MLPVLWLAASQLPAAGATEVDVMHEVAAARQAVDAVDATSCAAVLHDLTVRFDTLPRPSSSTLTPVAAPASLDLFALRQAVGDTLSELHEAGALSTACVDAARAFDMAQRRLTDDLLEAVHPRRRPEPWLSADGFDPSMLRSGDVLVTRGDALSSAGIARIGVHASHFSHNAMVYVDPDGAAWTIEAYLEKGALVQPLEDFLAHGVDRIAVVRYHQPELAAHAAEQAFRRIADGPAIPYDEALDPHDAEQLYCSQVAGWAFARVGGPHDIPLNLTPLDHDRRGHMFAGMGVTVDAFSAPADLLFDPRFRLVAEWRNLDRLEALRRQDAVVGVVFDRMDHDGYELTPRFAQKATVDVGLTLRRTPGLGQLVADQVHPKGERGFLVTSLTLQQAGVALHDALEADLGDRQTSRDELRARVEALVETDRQRWATQPRKASFHRLLAPVSDAEASCRVNGTARCGRRAAARRRG